MHVLENHVLVEEETRAQFFARLIEERDLVHDELAAMSGVSGSTITNLTDGENLRRSTYRKIIEALHRKKPLQDADIARISEIVGYKFARPAPSRATSMLEDAEHMLRKHGAIEFKLTIDALVYSMQRKGKGPKLIGGLYATKTPPVQKTGHYEETFYTTPLNPAETLPKPSPSTSGKSKHKRA